MVQTQLFPELQQKLSVIEKIEISAQRKKVLQPLIDFIQKKKNTGEAIKLNFICTHNSRRSQLGQVWAQTISSQYGLKTECFSGGTEKTAFFKNAIDALRRAGFRIELQSGENPEVKISYVQNQEPLVCYSKTYDAEENPSEKFAAILTCSHADENCPLIPGAESRIALDYKDPKEFDHTPLAASKYDERSDQIASEMNYLFKNIS